MRDIAHAATRGYKRTLCGRPRGYTVIYRQQVTCMRCLGGLERPSKKTAEHAVVDLHTGEPWRSPDREAIASEDRELRNARRREARAAARVAR